MKTLSHQEIRDVQKLVQNIRYPTDIFTRLPLELSQTIAQYLGLSCATRARGVSKDWYNLLVSYETTRCLLRPWHATGGSTLRIPDGLSQSAISSLEAEHINAYRSGTAFDRLTVERPISRHGTISNSVVYSNGKVAWIDKNTTTSHVLSLEDNGCCLTNEGDGEVLNHLALSGSMMAVTTLTGECRITDFAKGVEHRLQLNPTMVEKIVVAKETLAVLHKPLTSKTVQVGLTTWTLDNRTSLHFIPSLHRSPEQALRPCDLKIMLDISGSSVNIFEREAQFVYFTRLNLEGRVQAEGTLRMPITEGYGKHSEESTPTNINGWATVWSYSNCRQLGRNTVTIEVVRVQYELDRDVLRLKEDSFEIWAVPDLIISNIFFWNDIAYCQVRSYGCTFLNIVDFSKSFMTSAFMGEGMRFTFGFQGSERRDRRDRREFLNSGDMLPSLFLGDERFLVNACQYGFLVWTFDKNHGMVKTDAGYKEKRKEAKKNRSGPWSRGWPGHRWPCDEYKTGYCPCRRHRGLPYRV